MIIDDVMTDKITLHGLGFVQIQLEGNQRMHVWHPELPRRTCFQVSDIHDHRFTFQSQVLVGEQTNIQFEHQHANQHADAGDNPIYYVTYLHEGARTACGGRPWVPDGCITMTKEWRQTIKAGDSYLQPAYIYHRTQPGGNGKVATLMKKLSEGNHGAHSTCVHGFTPDVDFDRFQWSPAQLWEIVADVLLGQKVAQGVDHGGQTTD